MAYVRTTASAYLYPSIKGCIVILPFTKRVGISFLAAISLSLPAVSQPPQNDAKPVKTLTLAAESVQIWKDYSGKLAAIDFVEIRPQVSGMIAEVLFNDGQTVKKDDTLFVIDPRPYQAALDIARAELKASKEQTDLKLKELRRAQDLIKTRAISQRLLDESANAYLIARSAVAGAEARVKELQITLDYATVKAPITGTISRAEITEGNLVQAGPAAPILASIVSEEGIYGDFNVDESTYVQLLRTNGDLANTVIPVTMHLPGDDQIYEGKIHTFDNRIDNSSGTIRARAIFEKNRYFLPGMFATFSMSNPKTTPSLLVPESAINTDQDRQYVFTLVDGKVTYQQVTLGERVKNRRVVLTGLDAGDQVITEGQMRLRPGMAAKAK